MSTYIVHPVHHLSVYIYNYINLDVSMCVVVSIYLSTYYCLCMACVLRIGCVLAAYRLRVVYALCIGSVSLAYGVFTECWMCLA
jgi:hypothetical protein